MYCVVILVPLVIYNTVSLVAMETEKQFSDAIHAVSNQVAHCKAYWNINLEFVMLKLPNLVARAR